VIGARPNIRRRLPVLPSPLPSLSDRMAWTAPSLVHALAADCGVQHRACANAIGWNVNEA
jgi:hypothetical protein